MFSWSFNTSSGGMDLPKEAYTNQVWKLIRIFINKYNFSSFIYIQGSASLLSYIPKSQMDYGTVLCWASNLVGRQLVPCVFHVIPAGNSNIFIYLITYKQILYRNFFSINESIMPPLFRPHPSSPLLSGFFVYFSSRERRRDPPSLFCPPMGL